MGFQDLEEKGLWRLGQTQKNDESGNLVHKQKCSQSLA